MGFLHPPPHCSPPCAPFPPPHGCRRPYRSCSGTVPAAAVRATLHIRATSAVAASSWSAPPTLSGPPRNSRRHKVGAPAPLSPALYHVLPRTSSFSNINICSVFPASPDSASIARLPSDRPTLRLARRPLRRPARRPILRPAHRPCPAGRECTAWCTGSKRRSPVVPLVAAGTLGSKAAPRRPQAILPPNRRKRRYPQRPRLPGQPVPAALPSFQPTGTM